MALTAGEVPPLVWPRGPWNKLHSAAQRGSEGMVWALLASRSIDIDQGEPKGYTPLFVAVANGHPHIVSILLSKGANTSVVADNGMTALHVAAKYAARLDITKMLLAAGADTNVTAAVCGTPLHVAAEEGNCEVMRVLIAAGANIDARMSGDGATPLCLAASNGRVAAARELLRANADPQLTSTEESGKTHVPLALAAGHGYSEVVRELIQHAGIENCGGASAGVDALAWAAQGQYIQTMEILAGAGVVDTGLALYSAASWGGEVSVNFLLRQQRERLGAGNRAYVNSSCGPLPPVYGSIAHGRSFAPKVVRQLVDAGLDPTSNVTWKGDNDEEFNVGSPLACTNELLRRKTLTTGEDATEEQLHTWQAIRRFLMRVEAVDAVSWLWASHARCDARAVQGTNRATTSTSLALMLPLVRRRARARRVLLRSLFRWAANAFCAAQNCACLCAYGGFHPT